MANKILTREEFEQLVINFVDSVESCFAKNWHLTKEISWHYDQSDKPLYFLCPNLISDCWWFYSEEELVEKIIKNHPSIVNIPQSLIKKTKNLFDDIMEPFCRVITSYFILKVSMIYMGLWTSYDSHEKLCEIYRTCEIYRVDLNVAVDPDFYDVVLGFLDCYETLFYGDFSPIPIFSDKFSDPTSDYLINRSGNFLNPLVADEDRSWWNRGGFLRLYRELKTYLHQRGIFTKLDIEEMNSDKPYVYFILDAKDGKVKIGKSNDPEKRLKTLQTGHYNKLELIRKTKRYEESAVHKRFAHYKGMNEWFEYSEEIKHFISTL